MSSAATSTSEAAGRIPWALVARAGLLLTIIVFLFQLPFFIAGRGDQVAQELAQTLFVCLWLLLATAFTRTVPLSTLVSFWFVGLYPVVALSILVGQPLASSLGVDNPIVYAFWVPITEEVLKALPILLFFYLAARRGTWQPSASDGLLLGCAVGSGFAFHEDAMFSRVGGGGWGAATPWSYFLPTLAQGSGGVILSHTGWTALVGLSIGLAFLYRERRWTWVLPLGAYVLVAFDHIISNYYSSGSASGLPALLYSLDLNGMLPILALLGTIAVALVLERRILTAATARDTWFPPIPLAGFIASVGGPTRWPAIIHWQGFFEYARYRRALHYAGSRRRATPLPAQASDAMVRTVFMRGRAAGLAPAT